MQNNLQKNNLRFWEIDFLRGVAVIMMIIFHIIFYLTFFQGAGFNIYSGWWYYWARVTASSFIFLAGTSLALSWFSGYINYYKYFKRGLWIFGWGLVVTMVTWFFYRPGFVFFGILHFFGLATILVYPFLRLKWFNLFFGSLFIGLGFYLKNLVFSFAWLAWLGLKPAELFSIDYVPFFPWFGLILFGIFFGKILYAGYQRQFFLKEIDKNKVIQPFCWLGQNSLLIYFLHQPVLISILTIFRIIDKITVIN